MIKSIVLALGASLCLASLAFAQAPAAPPASTSAAAPAPAAATPAPAEEMTKDGKPKVKEIREACRTDAKSQGLKGEEKQKAIMDCVVKQRPDLAGREQCRMDGRAKGLKKDDLKAFVKDCAKAKA